MPKLRQSKLVITLLTVSFILACFIGCGEDTDTNGDGNGEAPPLPPDDSMTMDLSAFGGDKLGAPIIPNIPGTQSSFNTAAATVIIANTTIVAALATPAAVFTVAKSSTPVEQDDSSWLWSYSKMVGLQTFTANLTAKEEGDKTSWSMKISSDSILMPLDNFEWYTGTSSKDNVSGSWQFFDATKPDEASPAIAIKWQVSVSLEGLESDLTFTNQKADSEHVGDVLDYSVEGGIASISFTEAAEDITSIIEWDLKTSAGSITAPFYSDGEKACWDEDKQNVDCE